MLTNLTEGYDCINDYIGKETYSYNAWGQLVNYNNDVGETASYTYYSDGLRASKTIGDNTTKYYYDGDNVINETLNNNNYATNVMGVNGYVSRRQNGTTGYLFKDAHGDVLSIYTSTSNKAADYTYDAWGEIQTKNESSSFENNPLRYYGQYYDCESNMTYLRARYYDSSIRRFITEDPAKDGSNWYVYAYNNPIIFIDKTGMYGDMVMVKYAVEKAGGSVNYDSSNNTAVVSLNGITKTYQLNNINVQNGRFIISTQDLVDTFGVSSDKLIHKPGDYFETEEDTAMAWTFTYGKDYVLDPNEHEYSSAIYYVRQKGYSFTTPQEGYRHKSDVITTAKGELKANIHTHPKLKDGYPNNSFSKTDTKIAKKNSINYYVAVPIGYLYKFDYKIHTEDNLQGTYITWYK